MDYQFYLQGGLLRDRYLRVEGLNEGSFGIVSIAKDTQNNDALVAVKYNSGRLADFVAYQQHQNKTKTDSLQLDVRSFSLNSNTRSVIRSNQTYTNTQHSGKDVSKSIILRETKQEVLMIKKVGDHPNITKLIDSFDTFMIMEFCPRGDLHDAIQLGIAPVATNDVIDVFMQLISAVEFCHKHGVYHRDIKPENILISEDWSIKLTDFGLATDHLICRDFDVGSERYMAPELLEHSDIDSYAADKVDIWALGIVLLNIVFGKSPFSSASSKDKMFLYFAANRETLFDIFPFMSYDLFSVMIHSLTIDPANRDLEMIKESLLNIDVLTYDYEFEEETDIKNKNPLVEEPEEASDGESKESANAPTSSSVTYKTSDTPLNVNDAEDETTEREPSPASRLSQVPSIHIENENKIDELLDDKVTNSAPAMASKPITIKRYEPPHKLLFNRLHHENRGSNSFNTKNSNGNGNLNSNGNGNLNSNVKPNNFRARRVNFEHRKPLRIANYNFRNKSQDSRFLKKEETFDFNRQDFFTPKSVFSSYMEKANRGKQQLQKKGAFYHQANHTDYYNKNKHKNHRYSYNDDFCDRRAWQKRKRRSSHAYNVGNRNNNSNCYKSNNNNNNNNRRSNNGMGGIDGASWRQKADQQGITANHRSGRRSSTNYNFTIDSAMLLNGNRTSVDGKYIPPNLRLTKGELQGSAVLSDDDFEEDDREDTDEELHNMIDDDGDFSFDFEESEVQPHNVNIRKKSEGPSLEFNRIQLNSIDLLSKQLAENKIFDDKVNSRDTSLTTTVSTNHSSIGSNINCSPNSYKKYVPPHHRRSSHSAAETPDDIKKHVSTTLLNYIMDRNSEKNGTPISTSAPTKSHSPFHHLILNNNKGATSHGTFDKEKVFVHDVHEENLSAIKEDSVSPKKENHTSKHLFENNSGVGGPGCPKFTFNKHRNSNNNSNSNSHNNGPNNNENHTSSSYQGIHNNHNINNAYKRAIDTYSSSR